jgi:hypothetical protein
MKFSSTESPHCPFCYHIINPPKETKKRRPSQFALGICNNCGAVYAYDPTGHNRGAAFVEALLFACDYDEDLAFGLSAEEDYIDTCLEHYDTISHKVISKGIFEERQIRGVLIFVKLHEEIQEVTEPRIKERFKRTIPLYPPKLRSKDFSKKKVRTYVIENKLDDLLALAQEDSRLISELQRMLYTGDERLRWQVIEILGVVSKKVAEKRPDMVSKLLYRLLYSSADSAASAWGALEAAGAIISNSPDLFGEFSKPLLQFLGNKTLSKEASWAIGKIASKKPDLVKYAFSLLCLSLKNEDPTLRGYAAWALGELGNQEAKQELKKVKTDNQHLFIYQQGQLKEKTVAQLAIEAIKKLNTCANHK